MKKRFLAVLVSLSMLPLAVFPARAAEYTGVYEVGIGPGSGTSGTHNDVIISPGVDVSSSSYISTLVGDSPLALFSASLIGSKYAQDPRISVDLGFSLVSPASSYNGAKVAEGSVRLYDGSWATIGYDNYIDDVYYRLLREETDTNGTQWYIVSVTGTQIGNYHSLDGSSFAEVWLKKGDCLLTNTISLNTSNTLRQNIVRTALSLLGKGYAYGSTGPDTFDCSGFVNYVMNQNGISVPRTSTEICQSAGSEIDGGVSGLRPGDIIGRSGHVGIYIGDGYFVHSSEANTGVKVDSVWEYNQYTPFTNYRNVIGD